MMLRTSDLVSFIIEILLIEIHFKNGVVVLINGKKYGIEFNEDDSTITSETFEMQPTSFNLYNILSSNGPVYVPKLNNSSIYLSIII